MPAVVPTAIPSKPGPTHGPAHSSVVDQLSTDQNGLDVKVVEVSNSKSQRKLEKASSPTPSSQDGLPRHPDIQSPLNASPLANGTVALSESEASFAQAIRQVAQQLLLNIAEIQPQDSLGAGEESTSLQTNSPASTPGGQSVGSVAGDDTNLSNIPLFVAPADWHSAVGTKSHVVALSSPLQQTREEAAKSSTHSQSSSRDLQEALVLLARGKEEAKATILELEQKLEEQELRCTELEKELVIAQTEVQQVRESHVQQQQASERYGV